MIFDVAPLELVILGGVALLVIPPKDLPRAMRFAGQWIGKARGMARQFRSGFDDMIREAEFAEMEKKWKAENERIMREFPQVPALEAPLGESSSQAACEAEPVTVTPPVLIGEPPPSAGDAAIPSAPALESEPASSSATAADTSSRS